MSNDKGKLDSSLKVLESPRSEWYGNSRFASGSAIDWSLYPNEKYLLAQCDIVCSVETEADGHTIKPWCNELVNANGNAWTTPVLQATYKSFVGVPCFQDHVEIGSLAKGKVIDAALRPVQVKNSNGEGTVWFCSLLVATDRKHDNLCKMIQNQTIRAMSMGCDLEYATCSHCGKEIKQADGMREDCLHIKGELRRMYRADDGSPRITAELCGRQFSNTDGTWRGDPSSCRFKESSWVWHPAFTKALVSHLLENDKGKLVAEMAGGQIFASASGANEYLPDDFQFDIEKLRVADPLTAKAIRWLVNQNAINRRARRISIALGME